MTSFTLIPLDDRPACLALPAEVAAIAGVTLDVPPTSLLPHARRTPAPGGLARWFTAARPRTDASIVSLDALAFGSLIASRTGTERIDEVLASWAPLLAPGPAVHAAIAIPRSPDTRDASEEPDYWDPYGPDLHRMSRALSEPGARLTTALAELGSDLPAATVRDWMGRRLRQHVLAMTALDLLRRNVLASLIIGVDDASPGSLSAAAQHELETWSRIVGTDDRAFIQPGADETAAVLVARAYLRSVGGPPPRVALVCADPAGLQRHAAYETQAVGRTLVHQLTAAGALPTDDAADADTVLVVHPPADGRYAGDWALTPPQALNEAAADRTAALLAGHLDSGRRVALADVHQPNGADPALVAAVSREMRWDRLDGFAGWNTAGNTIGTVAAQVVVTHCARRAGTFDPDAHLLALARRVLEDHGWMSVVRARARADIGSDPTRHDTVDPDDPRRTAWESHLGGLLATYPGLERVRLTPDSLSFPWQRTFEMDLELTLEPTP